MSNLIQNKSFSNEKRRSSVQLDAFRKSSVRFSGKRENRHIMILQH